MSLLSEQIRSSFQNIISAFGLNLKSISENWVVLINKDYAIGVILDRDGLSYMYYDNASGGKAYNLGLYLVNKRRDQLIFVSDDRSSEPLVEYLEHNINVFVGHLTKAGQDILRGEKAWLREYSWPSVDFDKKILAIS